MVAVLRKRNVAYRAAAGAHMTDKKANELGQYVDRLRSKHGKATPEIIEEDARLNKVSPFRSVCEWDDKIAGRLYRMTQIASVLRKIEVVVEDAKGRQTTTRAFPNVEIENNARSYEQYDIVISRPDLRSQVIAEAKAQAEAWVSRYKRYRYLAKATAAVGKVVEDMKRL